MSTSIVLIGVGFIIAWLGAIMVYLSLRADMTELNKKGFGFLNKPFTKAKESRRFIKFFIIVGIIVTAILYAASWIGLIAW